MTVWFRHELKGPVMISYDATAVSAGGANDRVSDLNSFWMATDPASPKDIFAHPRSGAFAGYNSLRMYYVGLGGNGNTTTRFRRYIGDTVERPLLPENDLSVAEHPEKGIVANKSQRVTLVADGGLIQYWRDGGEALRDGRCGPVYEGVVRDSDDEEPYAGEEPADRATGWGVKGWLGGQWDPSTPPPALRLREVPLRMTAILVGEDGAVADLVLLDPDQGLVGIGHGEALGDGLDAVAGGDVQHLVEIARAASGTAGDGLWPAISGKAWMEMGEGGTPTTQSVPLGRRPLTMACQSWSAPTVESRRSKEPAIFFERAVVAGVDEVVRAEPARLFFLVGRGGEGGDLGAEGPGELQTEVAQVRRCR